LLAPTVLAMGLVATLSWASTVLDVASLLDNPESYQFEFVRVTGIVVDHRIHRWRANRCVQSFTLRDGTGSIRAVQRANCAGAHNSLRDRDLVTVEARFEWTPGKSSRLNVRSILGKVAPGAR
jgi:hypothetical protein